MTGLLSRMQARYEAREIVLVGCTTTPTQPATPLPTTLPPASTTYTPKRHNSKLSIAGVI